MMTPDPAEAGGIRDEELVRYLLGQLPEHEAERLDELSVADDAIALRLRSTEDDLVDAYVRGGLTGERRERFQAFYLSSPHRRVRVEFAAALRTYSERAALHASPTPSRETVSDRAIDRADRSPRAGRLRAWALAAAAIVAMATASYFALENRHLRQEIVQVQAARGEAERTAQGLRTELDQERSIGDAVRNELTRLRESLPSVPVPSLRPFVLLPMRRGVGETPTVVVAKPAVDIPFRLRLELDDFQSYVVALKRSSTGQIVWRSGQLSAASADAARHVDVQIPAGLTNADTYALELSGIGEGGAPEFVTSYAFRVALK